MVSQVKLIAEPWDVGEGGYQVGNFPPLWTEWNGKYRDTVRDFWRGEPATLGEFASRLTGSSDLYQDDGRRPVASINFVTAPRRLHPAATWSPTTTSTTRPTARTTATARATTGRGTAASRARPTTRRSLAAARPAAAQLPGHAAALPGRADARWAATSSAAPSAATTTPTARTTSSPGSTGTTTGTSRAARVHPAAHRAPRTSTRCSGAAGSSRASRSAAADDRCRDIAWFTPTGEEMTDERLGRRLRHVAGGLPQRRGHPRAATSAASRSPDDSFLLLFNAHDDAARRSRCPASEYGERVGASCSTPPTPSTPDEPRSSRPATRVRDAGRSSCCAGRTRPRADVAPAARDGRACPVSTYRLQLTPGFGFDDARPTLADYLRRARRHATLYLSPLLQADARLARTATTSSTTPRSTTSSAGEAACARWSAAAARARPRAGRRHRAQPHGGRRARRPTRRWWDVLRDGPRLGVRAAGSTSTGTAAATAAAARCSAPTTAGRARRPAARRRRRCATTSTASRSPTAPRTASAARRCSTGSTTGWSYWRRGDAELNYRRFFDVDVAGRRCGSRTREVFDATHARCCCAGSPTGVVDGLRVDHPDGLRRPARLPAPARASRRAGAWVVVEKILEPGEELPATGRCAGTTGYDALRRIGGLFVDPAGEAPLDRRCTRSSPGGAPSTAPRSSHEAKLRRSPTAMLAPRCRGSPRCGSAAAATRTAARRRRRSPSCSPRSRSTGPTSCPAAGAAGDLDRAARRPSARPPPTAGPDAPSCDAAARCARCRRDPPTTSWSCGSSRPPAPVMAKGVEDTAFYRWTRLVALNEVGGDPDRFGVDRRPSSTRVGRRGSARWPAAMTTLSTHDTKRSEDVRARLAVLSEMPGRVGRARCGGWTAPPRPLPRPGARRTCCGRRWSAPGRSTGERLHAYAREGGPRGQDRTRPGPTPTRRTRRGARRGRRGARRRRAARRARRRSSSRIAAAPAGPTRSAQKLRPADHARRARRLPGHRAVGPLPGRPGQPPAGRLRRAPRRCWPRLDAGWRPPVDADAAAQAAGDARALRLRRRPARSCSPATRRCRRTGRAAEHAVAFDRGGGAVTVATRLPLGLARRGGWGDTTVAAARRRAGATCSPGRPSTAAAPIALAELLADAARSRCWSAARRLT